MNVELLPIWAVVLFVTAVVVLVVLYGVKKFKWSIDVEKNLFQRKVLQIIVNVLCFGAGVVLLVSYPHAQAISVHALVLDLLIFLGGVYFLLSSAKDERVYITMLTLISLVFCTLMFCNIAWGCVWVVITLSLNIFTTWKK